MAASQRTIRRIPPHLRITLDGSNLEQFEIEELTLNPFVNSNGSASVWAELLLRRASAIGDNDNTKILAPDVMFEFNTGASSPTPSVASPSRTLEIESASDMNFLMHSDIWYSFVRSGGEDREFMERGYNKPIRVLYSCDHCTGQTASPCITHRSWMTLDDPIFKDARDGEVNRLLNNMRTANEAFRRLEDSALSERGPDPVGIGVTTLALSNDRLFSPVLFERRSVPCGARFAVRRLPWVVGEEADRIPLYGITYGATASIARERQGFRLSPELFSQATAEKLDPLVAPGEGVRFWVRWDAETAVTHHIKRERLGFSHSFDVQAPVRYLNSFLRMPPGFRHVPGGITDYKNYNVPPRLFFFWETPDSDQCLAFSELRTAEARIIELGVELENSDYERNRFVDLFIVGLTINILVAVFVQDLYSDVQHRPYGGRLHLDQGAALSIAVLFVAALAVYTGRALRKRYLAVALFLSFASQALTGVTQLGHATNHALQVGCLMAGLLALLHAIHGLGHLARAADHRLGLPRLRRSFARRRVLRSIRTTSLEPRLNV